MGKKISELTAAGALDGTELVELETTTPASVHTTAQDVANLATGIKTGTAPNGTVVTIENAGDGTFDLNYPNDSPAISVNADATRVMITGYDSNPGSPTAAHLQVNTSSLQSTFPSGGYFRAMLVDEQNRFDIADDGGIFITFVSGGTQVFYVSSDGSFGSASGLTAQGSISGTNGTFNGTVTGRRITSVQAVDFTANGYSETRYISDPAASGNIAVLLDDAASDGTVYTFIGHPLCGFNMVINTQSSGVSAYFWDQILNQVSQVTDSVSLIVPPGRSITFERIDSTTWYATANNGCTFD